MIEHRRAQDDARIRSVVDFWKDAGERHLWFAKDAAFDRVCHDRFLGLHMEVAARKHDHWIGSPDGALALLILTDQVPRNAFRGTAHMYATDPLARHYAQQALDAGHMERVDVALRAFFCLPFEHSEDLRDQDLSVRLSGRLGQPWLAHAEQHRDIIRRFGRFPHRNPMLARATTVEEARFLEQGGFRG
jgi:uncharacterized protein (DUF924 family)